MKRRTSPHPDAARTDRHATTRRSGSDEGLRRRVELLQAIEEAQSRFIDSQDPRPAFQQMLQTLVTMTGSEYGFIDEVDAEPDGMLFKRSLALSDISWDDQSRALFEKLRQDRFEFHNIRNLAGEPARTRQIVIANDPANHPASGGLPPGHPVIRSYLGIPMLFAGELLGVMGVANRPGGYDHSLAEFLRPYVSGCASMIHALKSRREHHQMTEALRASEERYRLFVEAAHEGVWAMDANQRTTYVNAEMARILGRDPAAILGRPVTDFMHLEDLDDHAARMAARTRGEGETYERRFRRGDGATVWCQVTATSLHAPDGSFAGSFALFTDITHRKQMEAAQRLNEARLSSLLAIAHHPAEEVREFLDFVLTQVLHLTGSSVGYIYHYDEDRREFTLNTWSKGVMAQCAITKPQTVYQLDQTGIWGEAVRQRRPILVNDFAAQHPLKKGYPAGHVELTRFLTVPIFFGDRIVAVAGVGNKADPYDDDDIMHLRLTIDAAWRIVHRREAVLALQESEERFRALAEAADEGVVLTRDGRIIDCNRRFIDLAGGADRSDILRQSVLGFFEDPWKSLVAERIRTHAETPYEAEVTRLDEGTRWVRISPRETMYRGEPVRVAAVQDLTEQRRAAERLRRTNDRLRALASQVEAVREEEKARISRRVHDDLGQVLTAMKIEIQRVAEWHRKPLGAIEPARFETKLGELTRLAEQALDTARNIARELRPSLIDDLGLLAALDCQMSSFRERSGLDCHLRITVKNADFPQAVAIGIFRILQEALTNILRHARARTVTVRLFRHARRLVFAVIDDGIGLSPDQTEAATSLGLLGMRERALQLGGVLTVTGQPGRGTTVRLEIPVERLRQATTAAATPIAPGSG